MKDGTPNAIVSLMISRAGPSKITAELSEAAYRKLGRAGARGNPRSTGFRPPVMLGRLSHKPPARALRAPGGDALRTETPSDVAD